MKHIILILAVFFSLSSFDTKKQEKDVKMCFVEENTDFATKQLSLLLNSLGEPNGKNYPRTMADNGKLIKTNKFDWTSGFFAGTLWYMYELTNDTLWRTEAEKWTNSLESLKTFTKHHDLGFMMYCSYGNAERLSPKSEYRDILIQSAYSLATRFNKNTGVIKSWDYRLAWDGKTEMFYPVIIDNMMNLELLFYAAKTSGDQHLYNIAVIHANNTLKNHFREDYSSYHVVDYDSITGAVKHQVTCQGYSDNSTWSRGQAWAIYGYTMMFRETKDSTYLKSAVKMTDLYLSYINNEDPIPLWDFNVAQKGFTPGVKSNARIFKEKLKDTSAAAITCSALFELDRYLHNKEYIDYAVKTLYTLASDKYRANLGENANFIIKHSVGSIPHNFEIDKPIVYTDYYFLEALIRYKNWLKMNE